MLTCTSSKRVLGMFLRRFTPSYLSLIDSQEAFLLGVYQETVLEAFGKAMIE